MLTRYFHTTGILTILIMLLTVGCSIWPTSNSDMSAEYVMEDSIMSSPIVSQVSEMSIMPEPSTNHSKSSLNTDDSSEIYTGSITIEVDSIEANLSTIKQMATNNNGYVEHLNSYGTDYNQNANITLRIPQNEFYHFMDKLESLGIVLNKSIGAEDVSEQLIDLNARLKNYTREETSLLNLLDKSTSISDIVAVERELSRIRSEIESIEGRLKYYDSKILMSTINISLVTPYSNSTGAPYGVMELSTSNVTQNLNTITNFIENDDGNVEYISSNYKDGAQSIEVSILIKRSSFDKTFKFIESLGTIKNKFTNEPQNANEKIAGKIDSRITVTLTESRYLTPNAITSIVTTLIITILGAIIWLISRKEQS
tara:strand:- start:6792 stop:7898 length:1107 start_codon:yes stop_codon:yes gene_type:complete